MVQPRLSLGCSNGLRQAGYFRKGIVMKRIPLTQGKFAIVDDEDYEWLNQWKWTLNRCGKDGKYLYAGREANGKQIRMHRQILGLTKNDPEMADHINHNGLDNRKCNVRICSNQQNQANSKRKNVGSSKYLGVRWHNNKWAASIGKKRSHIGYYKNEIDAAKAYDKKAKELFGEYAHTNF